MRIYLDNCCYNRPYDDQSKIRIRLETKMKKGPRTKQSFLKNWSKISTFPIAAFFSKKGMLDDPATHGVACFYV